jgi:hypothetical protein
LYALKIHSRQKPFTNINIDSGTEKTLEKLANFVNIFATTACGVFLRKMAFLTLKTGFWMEYCRCCLYKVYLAKMGNTQYIV